MDDDEIEDYEDEEEFDDDSDELDELDEPDELDEDALFDLEAKGAFDAGLENDLGYSDFREYGASVDFFDDLSEEEKDAYDRGYYGAK